MTTSELVQVAALLVTLMIFFSIDAKFRFRRDEVIAKGLFRVMSLIGGLFTVIALVIVWIEMFMPDENGLFPVLAYFIPASIAIFSALVLGIEVTFLRGLFGIGDDDEGSSGGGTRDDDANAESDGVNSESGGANRESGGANRESDGANRESDGANASGGNITNTSTNTNLGSGNSTGKQTP